VDRITSRTSADPAADWREVEELLQRAYRAASEAAGEGKPKYGGR
jgi:hypothetical protein